MRNYKYIWRKNQNEVVMSGMEFYDFRHLFSGHTLLMLKHKCDSVNYDRTTRFDYINADAISETSKEIYSWGDFVFMNFIGDKPCDLTRDEIKSLLYFTHTGIFDAKCEDSRIMGACYIHDDGWYLSYTGSSDIIDGLVKIAVKSIPTFNVNDISDNAVLLYDNHLYVVPETTDIDMILNVSLREIKSAQQADAPEPLTRPGDP